MFAEPLYLCPFPKRDCEQSLSHSTVLLGLRWDMGQAALQMHLYIYTSLYTVIQSFRIIFWHIQLKNWEFWYQVTLNTNGDHKINTANNKWSLVHIFINVTVIPKCCWLVVYKTLSFLFCFFCPRFFFIIIITITIQCPL